MADRLSCVEMMEVFVSLSDFYQNTDKTENFKFSQVDFAQEFAYFHQECTDKKIPVNHENFWDNFWHRQENKENPIIRKSFLYEEKCAKESMNISRSLYESLLEEFPDSDFCSNIDRFNHQSERFGVLEGWKCASFLNEFLDKRNVYLLNTYSMFGKICREKFQNLDKGYQDLGFIMYHGISVLCNKKQIILDDPRLAYSWGLLDPDKFQTFCGIQEDGKIVTPISRDYGQSYLVCKQRLMANQNTHGSENG